MNKRLLHKKLKVVTFCTLLSALRPNMCLTAYSVPGGRASRARLEPPPLHMLEHFYQASILVLNLYFYSFYLSQDFQTSFFYIFLIKWQTKKDEK